MGLSTKRDVRFDQPKVQGQISREWISTRIWRRLDEIFLPVVKMTTLRFMLGVVAADNLELIQLDVKMAFLHGDLQEEIYMEQPKGSVAYGQEHLVYRVRKSLYACNRHPDNGTRSSTTSSSRSASPRAMRTSISSPKQLKTGLPSSS